MRPTKIKAIIIRVTPREHAAIKAYAEQMETDISKFVLKEIFKIINRKTKAK